jgi:hypothetical protein
MLTPLQRLQIPFVPRIPALAVDEWLTVCFWVAVYEGGSNHGIIQEFWIEIEGNI